MNTSTRRFKGQALLSTVVSPEEKLIYFVRSTYRNEQLQWEGPRNHQLEPKDEEVAFTLHTDRLVPKEFRTMISLFGEEFGLTKEQVRVMTASPKKTKTAGEKRGQNEH